MAPNRLDLTVHPLDCGHFEVFQPAPQRVLLRHLDAFLTRIAAAHPDSLQRKLV